MVKVLLEENLSLSFLSLSLDLLHKHHMHVKQISSQDPFFFLFFSVCLKLIFLIANKSFKKSVDVYFPLVINAIVHYLPQVAGLQKTDPTQEVLGVSPVASRPKLK